MAVATHPHYAGQITVLVADDEPQVRDMLAAYLAAEHGLFELVAVASDADEAIGLAAEWQPDVALVDYHMPGGGQNAVRGIRDRSPGTRIIALSGSQDRTTVLEMLRAGAASYVVKAAHPDGIVETILRSARGESVLAPEITGGVIGELATQLAEREREEEGPRRLAARVRRTIEKQQFEPVFQPIIALLDGATVGYEALTRFAGEPKQGPERWFADAEEVGLRNELELAAARAAIEHFVPADYAAFLSINASPEMLDACHELVDQLAPRPVVIEISEHAAIADYDALAPVLRELRARGVRLAVDDAGAGFASLRHTLQLEPDFIKLDITLTRGIDSDRRRRALAVGLIGFANELGATIVAEGIETAGERNVLSNLGVLYGQGYALAAPAALTS